MSEKAKSKSPELAPSSAPPGTRSPPEHAHPVQPELIAVADDLETDDVREDDDSALGTDAASSTASVTSSILEYRHIQGRTFHSDRHSTEYFTPNDERQLESVDITHHYLTLLLDGRLFLAPIKENPARVLDIGTGSGIWAIDFSDQYPQTEVIGSDLSPCQPQWVPPNVRFEIDDATQSPWTWKPDTFDFVHIRYLFGAVKDWTALYKDAYRCCAPGGWVQSCEADIEYRSDDGTTDNLPIMDLWNKFWREGGKALDRPFFLREDKLVEKGFEAAGFQDVVSVDYKVPVGGWPRDPKLREIGQFSKLTMDNDLEGYTMLLWNHVLNWPKDEYQVFLMEVRKMLANRKIHPYVVVRYVYGRKPAAEAAA